MTDDKTGLFFRKIHEGLRGFSVWVGSNAHGIPSTANAYSFLIRIHVVEGVKLSGQAESSLPFSSHR
jgi:hypothetical protein